MHKKIIAFLLAAVMASSTVFAVEHTYDLNEPCGLSEGQLQGAVYHELKPLAPVFLECEEEFGVNAVILSSIAAIESGWGTSRLAEDQHNLFGWTNTAGEFRRFADNEHCVRYVAEAIAKKYLDEAGAYYSGGTTVRHIADLYSEAEDWPDAVETIAGQIKQRAEKETLKA